MRIGIIAFLCVSASLLHANEPLWTPEQRAQQRQVVLRGTVQTIEKVKDQGTPEIHLMRATITVDGIEKGAELVGEQKQIVIHYESSPLGAGFRCPPYAVLKAGDVGKFYLMQDESLTGEKAFVLEMGSDFQRAQVAAASGKTQ